MSKKYLSPSLLAFDVKKIDQQLKLALNQNIKIIHYDVMDKNYVNNSSFLTEWLDKINSYGLKIHVHIMAYNPLEWLKKFTKYQFIEFLSFQYEADNFENVQKCLNYIKSKNIKCGIAIRHDSEFKDYYKHLLNVDYVVVMSVVPGFGGQGFLIDSMYNLKKIHEFRKKTNSQFKIAIDGGINLDNIKLVIPYCDYVVSGSAFMKASNVDRLKMIRLVQNNK